MEPGGPTQGSRSGSSLRAPLIDTPSVSKRGEHALLCKTVKPHPTGSWCPSGEGAEARAASVTVGARVSMPGWGAPSCVLPLGREGCQHLAGETRGMAGFSGAAGA